MNKLNKTRFDKIQRAAESYKGEVKAALDKYKADAEAAKAFKDEVGLVAAAKANARSAISRAEASFTSTVGAEIDGLRDELFQHMTSRPAAAFLDALRVYSDFKIRPEKIDIEALVKLNSGNTLGLRAINKVLEETDAAYRVEAPDSAQYEADLSALARLAQGNIRYAPDGYHTELTAIYKDTARLLSREDGSLWDAGYKWDSVSLLTATSSFKGQLAALDKMTERWTDTVLPSFAQIKEYKPKREDGKQISPAAQFLEDYEATADSASVTTAPDGQARRIGKTQAEETKRAAEIVRHYTNE